MASSELLCIQGSPERDAWIGHWEARGQLSEFFPVDCVCTLSAWLVTQLVVFPRRLITGASYKAGRWESTLQRSGQGQWREGWLYCPLQLRGLCLGLWSAFLITDRSGPLGAEDRPGKPSSPPGTSSSPDL